MALARRFFQVLLLACFTLVTIASSTPTLALPRVTSTADDQCDANGFSPKPTTAPFHLDLFKRQATFSTVCGYISGISTRRLTCGTGYCGKKSAYNAIGCCTTSTYVSASSETLLGGCTFRTQCWDSTAVSTRCTSTCLTDSAVLKCTNSGAAYCFRYSFTDIGSIILGCTTAPTTILAASTTDAIQATAPTTAVVVVTNPSQAPKTVTSTISPTSEPTSAVTVTSTASNGQSTVVIVASNNAANTGGGLDTIAPTSGQGIAATGTTAVGADQSTGSATSSALPSQTSATSGSHVGAIAGGAVGGVAALALLAGLIGFFLIKKKKKKTTPDPAPSTHPDPHQSYMAPSTMTDPSRPMSMAPTTMSQSPPPTVPSMYTMPPQQQQGGYYPQAPYSPPPMSMDSQSYTMGPPVYEMNHGHAVDPAKGYYNPPQAAPPPPQPQVYEMPEAPPPGQK